jgi:hypothetical protein
MPNFQMPKILFHITILKKSLSQLKFRKTRQDILVMDYEHLAVRSKTSDIQPDSKAKEQKRSTGESICQMAICEGLSLRLKRINRTRKYLGNRILSKML